MYTSLLFCAERDTGRRGQKVILIALVTSIGWGKSMGKEYTYKSVLTFGTTLMFYILTIYEGTSLVI